MMKKAPTIKEGAFFIVVLTHSVNFNYIYFLESLAQRTFVTY